MTTWCLAPGVAARIAWFDGEAVVFNEWSWQTHVLNEAGGRILAALGAGPRTREEIDALFAQSDEDRAAVAPMVAEGIEALLAELESVGLIQAAISLIPGNEPR